jgi:hypothetical protein
MQQCNITTKTSLEKKKANLYTFLSMHDFLAYITHCWHAMITTTTNQWYIKKQPAMRNKHISKIVDLELEVVISTHHLLTGRQLERMMVMTGFQTSILHENICTRKYGPYNLHVTLGSINDT